MSKINNIQYNLQFYKLCKRLSLGDLIDEPKPLSGGHLNRVYSLETTGGKYAVKAINPQIMIRPAAKRNYINSEHIANIASEFVPACAAKAFNGRYCIGADGLAYAISGKLNAAETEKFDKWMQYYLSTCEELSILSASLHGLNVYKKRI